MAVEIAKIFVSSQVKVNPAMPADETQFFFTRNVLDQFKCQLNLKK